MTPKAKAKAKSHKKKSHKKKRKRGPIRSLLRFDSGALPDLYVGSELEHGYSTASSIMSLHHLSQADFNMRPDLVVRVPVRSLGLQVHPSMHMEESRVRSRQVAIPWCGHIYGLAQRTRPAHVHPYFDLRFPRVEIRADLLGERGEGISRLAWHRICQRAGIDHQFMVKMSNSLFRIDWLREKPISKDPGYKTILAGMQEYLDRKLAACKGSVDLFSMVGRREWQMWQEDDHGAPVDYADHYLAPHVWQELLDVDSPHTPPSVGEVVQYIWKSLGDGWHFVSLASLGSDLGGGLVLCREGSCAEHEPVPSIRISYSLMTRLFAVRPSLSFLSDEGEDADHFAMDLLTGDFSASVVSFPDRFGEIPQMREVALRQLARAKSSALAWKAVRPSRMMKGPIDMARLIRAMRARKAPPEIALLMGRHGGELKRDLATTIGSHATASVSALWDHWALFPGVADRARRALYDYSLGRVKEPSAMEKELAKVFWRNYW